MAKVLIPVRYAAWLAGELGDRMHARLQDALPDAQLTRLPRGFLVCADEAAGVLLESVHRAVAELDAAVAASYPVFHAEMGPVWTGTLQSVFAPTPGGPPPRPPLKA